MQGLLCSAIIGKSNPDVNRMQVQRFALGKETTKVIKLIINIFILVLIIMFQSFTRKKKIVKCKENPDIIIQNAIHELLLSENESQIHICGKGKNETITLKRKTNGIFIYWISSSTNDDTVHKELFEIKTFLEEKGFMYNSKITIDTLDALKPYEYIVEYFDDIHANTGENVQDIFTLLREYFRIVLRITDLRSLTIDKRHMKVKAGKQRTALTH